MEQYLLEAVSDGVATLTLNRPERLNALSTPIMEGLLEALRRHPIGLRISGIGAPLRWTPAARPTAELKNVVFEISKTC